MGDSWRQKFCHDVKKIVMKSKSLLWRKKYVMMSNSLSWCQQYITTSTNLSKRRNKSCHRHQQIYRDVKVTSWHQKICHKVRHDINKFLMTSKSLSWHQKVRIFDVIGIFDFTCTFWCNYLLFNVLFYVFFDVMTYYPYFLSSWRTFWGNELLLIPCRNFDVMTYSLTSWRNISHHDIVVDVMT